MARRRPKITWWMRIRRFIYHFHSPFHLRSSIIRLSHHHKRPYLTLLRLFIPFPSWYFPVPDPVALQNIFENPSLLRSRLGDIVNLRTIPIWRARDTPLRSLYRLYEIMASGHYVLMGAETEYFWYQSRKQWELHSIEDPKDPDPVRYAILACLVEELTVAFNWRLSLGMRRNGKHFYRENDEDPYPPFVSEQVPSWTKYVPPIDPKFLLGFPPALVDTKGRLVLEEGGLNKIFANRNIITNVGWLYTI